MVKHTARYNLLVVTVKHGNDLIVEGVEVIFISISTASQEGEIVIFSPEHTVIKIVFPIVRFHASFISCKID